MNNISKPVVLISKINFLFPEQEYLSMLETVRETKKEKIKRFRFYEDKLRSLFGELLLQYALKNYWHLDYNNIEIIDDDFGKPILVGQKIFFNISHSGDWVSLICSENSCGIDVEKIENPPFEIMNKNYSQDEIDQVKNVEQKIQKINFYKIWTLKESYIKMIGKGLSIPLDSFTINMRDETIISVVENNCIASDVSFQLFNPDSYHIMAVCLYKYSQKLLPYEVKFWE